MVQGIPKVQRCLPGPPPQVVWARQPPVLEEVALQVLEEEAQEIFKNIVFRLVS